MQIQNVTRDKVNEALELLKGFENQAITKSDWLNLIFPPWEDDQELSKSKIVIVDNVCVGFIGLLPAPNFDLPATNSLINVSGVIFREGYAPFFPLCMKNLMNTNEATYTNLSPSENVANIFRKFGFVTLEDSFLLGIHSEAKQNLSPNPSVEIYELPVEPSRSARVPSQRLNGLLNLVMKGKSGETVLQISLTVVDIDKTSLRRGQAGKINLVPMGRYHGRYSTAHILSVSQPNVLSQHIKEFQRWMFLNLSVAITIIDRRLVVQHELENFERYRLPVPRLYLPSKHTSSMPDNSFSEFSIIRNQPFPRFFKDTNKRSNDGQKKVGLQHSIFERVINLQACKIDKLDQEIREREASINRAKEF